MSVWKDIHSRSNGTSAKKEDLPTLDDPEIKEIIENRARIQKCIDIMEEMNDKKRMTDVAFLIAGMLLIFAVAAAILLENFFIAIWAVIFYILVGLVGIVKAIIDYHKFTKNL